MMKSTSPSHKECCYSSIVWHESALCPGVHFAIRRCSLAQRIELTQRTRELTLKNEFLRAGDAADQLEASLSDLLARKLYLEWGLAEIKGLLIDAQPANVNLLVEKGPEDLVDEAISMIRSETALDEQERKNS
ncbi:MAG: hypothetical protein JO270_05085 [Acidobacteriaceae bacterium]|nr:hypothetical protein [Acidobacteriaceae bacterium]MBV8573066.1 hypothetical protein [Acidobacteriaceae bacterium]